MKKIITGLFLFCAQLSHGQRLPDVVGKRAIIKDSLKLRNIWYKAFPNLATANLTATGDYVHNWAGFSTVINNASSFVIASINGGDFRSIGGGSNPFLGVGINRVLQRAYITTNRPGFTTEVMCNDGLVRITGNTLEMRIGNHSVQPVGSVLTLANAGSGEMTWRSASSLTLDNWSVFGNGAHTVDMTLGTTNPVGFRVITNSVERMWFMSSGKIGVKTNAPVNNFDIRTGIGLKVVSIDNPAYTVTADDVIISMANGMSSATVTLPDAGSCPGRYIIIKRKDADVTATITVSSLGGNVQDKRNGNFAANYDLPSWGDTPATTFFSNGTDWEAY